MNTQEWLSQLISIDTTSYRSNLKLITLIQDWLNLHNIASHLTYDITQQKANLFATIPATNDQMNNGLILSGHTDVVPVDGQDWESDPFQAKITHENIYGRGATDMKGFIAVVLALVPQFKKMSLAKPLHFAFSYDEEVGCKGVPLLIADMQKKNIHPSACIVGEPTEMNMVVAHKGIQAFQCKVHGFAAHSSLTPLGCNAIQYAAQLINWIHHLSDHLKNKGPIDQHFDVPFTSMTVNTITGGTAANIIPALCEFIFEFRQLPAVNPQDIILQIKNYINTDLVKIMQRSYSEATIDFNTLASAPAFEAAENATITQLMRKILKDQTKRKVSYATEAGLFQNAHIPTVLCGPGNIREAHRANEFVSIAQLKTCETFLLQLVEQFMQI